MPRFSSQLKGSGETFDVVLSGGSPWGFTLQGGSEFRTKLCVSKVTPGGKADLCQSIAVGDEVVMINGIDCISRAEAIELVRCSRQKLKITLRREGGTAPVKQSNGPAVKKSSDIVPNLYKTASEHFSNSDFYSTYNVDRKKYAQITQNHNIYDSTDNLSASLDDLLESYRQVEKPSNVSNPAIMEETAERLSNSSTEIANGRMSPSPEVDGLRRINSLNNMTGKRFLNSTGLLGVGQFNRPGTEIYGRTWSLRRGVSLPEGNWSMFHQRTNTSPGRIQKVTVKSTNISLSPPKGSPPGRETENQQSARSNATPNDWVGRWLLDKPQRVIPLNAGAVQYKDKSKDKEIPDRRVNMHERSDNKKSQSLPRSKSFGGPTSYGVTVTATAVKRNEGSSTLPASRPPNRYSSSNLIQEKAARPGPTSDSRPDEAASRPIEMSWDSLVYAAPGDKVEVRLPRDLTAPKMTVSESTSSLDSAGTMDSSAGGARRQGPAPPPRRSVSKLLSSFRTAGRRPVPEEIPPKFGAVSRLSEGSSNQPIHSPSRSWPTENIVENKTGGNEVTRQSWHAEPAVMTSYDRREANSSISSTSSDTTPERKLSKSSSVRVKSSVVIRNMRSSSSSSVDENSVPTVYRSGQVSPETNNNRSTTLPPRKKLSEGNSPVKSLGDSGHWMSQNKRHTATEPSRIEDTQILQRLLLDKATNPEPAPSVKSRIANFEVGMTRKSSGGAASQEGRRFQNRSFSQGRIEVQRPMKSYSSMDSLLEKRPASKFNGTSTNKEGVLSDWAATRVNEATQKRGTLPEKRSPNRFNEISAEKRSSWTETRLLKSFNETTGRQGSMSDARSPTRFNEATMEKRRSLTETRSPTKLSSALTDKRDSEVESRSPTRFYTDKRENQSQSDKTPPNQWEAIGNSSQSRADEKFKRASASTFGVKNSLETREQKLDTRIEAQNAFEEPLRKFETSAHFENNVNSGKDRAVPLKDKLPRSNIPESDLKRKTVEPKFLPPPSNDDSEVFWDADDSFPPPPPLDLLDPLETSQDSLPLPSPPREVLVEFPTSYEDYSSRRNPAQREPAQVERDVIRPEEVRVMESAPAEIGEEPRVELNGPGKVDTSNVSEQPLETTSSTDLSLHYTSSPENKKGSHRAPPPSPLIITSTPTKDEPAEADTPLDNSTSPYSACSSTSTPSGSRPNSIMSPKLEALDKEKCVLVDSMKQKIVDLRSQMDEIKDEIDGNEELGEKVTKVVEKKTSPAEFSKYQLFTGELNKIIGLLLILTQRMHRYEMMLNDLDMSEEADRQQRDILLGKIDKVTLQHEEACKIKEVNDKRGEAVSKILENCLDEEEFADFQYYIDMKTQLALMHAEIRDKVKMGEERLNTLTSTKIDWSIFSLT